MPSPSFTLDAQLRFHDKWLKIDLQVSEEEIMWKSPLQMIWTAHTIFLARPDVIQKK